MTTGEEKFKVVHQEAMVLYDSHVNSLVPQEEKGEVVAVEPAKTHVEAVAKPKRTRKKTKADSPKKKESKKTDSTPAQEAPVAVEEPVVKETTAEAPQTQTEAPKKGWWNK